MEENLNKIEKGPKEKYREESPSETVKDKKEPSAAEAFTETLESKGELTEEEKVSREELEKELKKVKLSSQAQVQAQKEAEEMKKQTVEGKIQHLTDLAKAQGLAYAVEVAKKMDDPYLLDLFHDNLAKNGLFKEFLEK